MGVAWKIGKTYAFYRFTSLSYPQHQIWKTVKSDSVCVHSVCVAKHAKSDQAYPLLFCFLPSKNFLHIVIAVKCKQKGRLPNTYLAVPIMTYPIQYFLHLYFRSKACIKNSILKNNLLISLWNWRQSEMHM